MAELKKRKKSLNQIVNPQKQTTFLPSAHSTSFRQFPNKAKTKKEVETNVSSVYTYSNLIPSKPELKQVSKKSIVMNLFKFIIIS